jgi:hypothetical protein
MKTYTGGQGYVYQYYFVGKRPAPEGSSATSAIEYIFDVTSDRKTTFAVSVLLQESAVRSWTQAHGRAPTEAEEYGAVKMRLFKAFDEIEDMLACGRHLVVDAPALEDAFSTLGVD